MKFKGRLVFLAIATTQLVHAAPVDILLAAPDDTALRPLQQRLMDAHEERHAAWIFWTGKLAGKSVLLARTEGDPLNAVAVTTLAIHFYSPRLIVVYGPARAHDPALHTGDCVVSDRFVAFDGMVSPITALGDGTQPLKWSKLPHLLMTAGEKETPSESFPAAKYAVELALKLTAPRGRVVAGVLGSANQINREADRIAWIREQWHTSTEDADSAYVAGCAALFAVPVVGLGMIDGSGEEAAAMAQKLVEGLP